MLNCRLYIIISTGACWRITIASFWKTVNCEGPVLKPTRLLVNFGELSQLIKFGNVSLTTVLHSVSTFSNQYNFSG